MDHSTTFLDEAEQAFAADAREIAPKPRRALKSSAAPVSLGFALAACGGGSGGGSSGGAASDAGGIVTIVAPPAPAPLAITDAQASRFLGQATMGATTADIAEVKSRRFDGWIANEFSKARATTHWDWMIERGYGAPANMYSVAGFDNSMWSQLVGAGDQLRQRVGMALLGMLVVGIDGINVNWRQFAIAAYVDVLLDNAFGNFRTILDKVTTIPAMGSFLTFMGNSKANPKTGALPDENYAREVMQLFTIGLHRLNMDGTRVLSNGQPIETYSSADVSGLARVLTGLVMDTSESSVPDRNRRPMIMRDSLHETGASTFLGVTVAAGTPGMDAIKTALDTIFAHPNVPPFVSRQLIQRLVTSNPSPAYIGRVAAKFADNGSGVRGDMQAVIRAILLDEEARAEPNDTTAGKLREPVMRLTGWARAFGATSNSGKWETGDTSSPINRLGQSMGRAASVFNFFRPGYTPQNAAFANAGMVAPELQITNEISVVGYVNYMQSVVNNSTDLRTTYAELTPLTDTQALLDRANLLLAAGQISAPTIAQIKAAVDSTTNATNRIYIAILLMMASPEYLTAK